MYAPGFVLSDGLDDFLSRELPRISQAIDEPRAFLMLEMSYAAPSKTRDGMVVLADGTSWNPGSGGGFYGYRAGSWRFLG